MYYDEYSADEVVSFHFTVKVDFLTDQWGVCLIRLRAKPPVAQFTFTQSEKNNLCLSISNIPMIYPYLKMLLMCQFITQWLRSLDLPKPVSCQGPLLVYTGSIGSSPHPHPPLLLDSAWLSVEAGLHWGKPKESHRASSPVSQWRGSNGKTQRHRQKLRVGGYLSSGGKRTVSESAECTKGWGQRHKETSMNALRH